MNLDQLNNANLAVVTRAAFGLVDNLQQHPIAIQPLAAGLLFVALCDELGITQQKVLEVVSRLRRASDESVDQMHVKAIQQYIRKEL